MNAGALLLACAALCAASGLLALAGAGGRRAATLLHLLACAGGLVAALLSLADPGRTTASFAWALPGARLAIEIDGLSAVFLIPLFLVSGAVAVNAARTIHGEGERAMPVFHGLATAGMALVFTARNGVLFLVAWEAMALAGFFLVVLDGREKSVRDAGWIYLVATHTGTILLFVLFATLAKEGGSFALGPLPAGLATTHTGTALFWLAVAGFGLKAGLMPFHVWLPGAHAGAPSPVSALMSGVLIKTGVYGIVRVLSLFPDPPAWWGGTLLLLGAVSGVLGVAFALGQHDLKRLLAYHSVENIGIIVMGIGLGFLGIAKKEPVWIVLGFGGGLLHVVNHALFKSLLFLGAGSVLHAAGTREMDRLGGLGKRMPRTAALFLLGSVAICGLPPLNGFVSEWLIYLGLFGGPRGAVLVPFAIPALALIGGLAVACFTKAFGVVFLGEPRTAEAERAHEDPIETRPIVFLAILCAAIGLLPLLVAPLLDRAIAALAPRAPAIASMAPLGALGLFHLGLVALLCVTGFLLARRLSRSNVRREVTWDCGYAEPTPRMQYTSSSYARWSVGYFRWALRPHAEGPGKDGLFPREARFESHVPETVLDLLVLPALRRADRFVALARGLQQGRIQLYILYVGVTLVVLLLFV